MKKLLKILSLSLCLTLTMGFIGVQGKTAKLIGPEGRGIVRAYREVLKQPMVRRSVNKEISKQLRSIQPIAFINGYWVVVVDMSRVYGSPKVRNAITDRLDGKALKQFNTLARGKPVRGLEGLRVGMFLIPNKAVADGRVDLRVNHILDSMGPDVFDMMPDVAFAGGLGGIIGNTVTGGILGALIGILVDILGALWDWVTGGSQDAIDDVTCGDCDPDGDGIPNSEDEDDDGDGVDDDEDNYPYNENRSIIGTCGGVIQCFSFMPDDFPWDAKIFNQAVAAYTAISRSYQRGQSVSLGTVGRNIQMHFVFAE